MIHGGRRDGGHCEVQTIRTAADGEKVQMTTVSLVVMEAGSDWPGQIGDSTSLVAICQGDGDLFCIARARLGALATRRQNVRVAVLACNADSDGAVAERRGRLAHLMLGAVVATTCGRLVLSANRCASHDLRAELFSLAGALTEEIRGTTATVALRFEGASHAMAAGLAKTRPVAAARTAT
jgi:hypothetical protein